MVWNGSYLNGTEAEEKISLLNEPSIPIHCAYQAQLLDNNLNHNPREYFSYPLTRVLKGSGPNKRISFSAGASSLLSWLYQRYGQYFVAPHAFTSCRISSLYVLSSFQSYQFFLPQQCFNPYTAMLSRSGNHLRMLFYSMVLKGLRQQRVKTQIW